MTEGAKEVEMERDVVTETEIDGESVLEMEREVLPETELETDTDAALLSWRTANRVTTLMNTLANCILLL